MEPPDGCGVEDAGLAHFRFGPVVCGKISGTADG